MDTTDVRESESIKSLLFANFQISPQDAKGFLEDIERKPHKIPDYKKLLFELMEKQYAIIKRKTSNEIKAMAKERVREWSDTFGRISTQEFVMMSKHWNIPIDAFFDRAIVPETIKEMLDFFIIGQEEYKVRLAVSFHNYRMAWKNPGFLYPRSTLMAWGPSGSGKSYAIQVLAKLFHVPLVTIHCNSLVQVGIKGPCIPEEFTSLMAQGWTIEDTEHSFVVFEELDKLFEIKEGQNSGCFNGRIVNELLNILDDNGEVEFDASFKRNDERILKVSTRKMMFLFTGVFDGLDDIIKRPKISAKEKNRKPIGFVIPKDNTDELMDVAGKDPSEAFIRYGVKPEIVGRIRNFVYLEALSVEQMANLFELGSSSPFNDYQQYFHSNGINAILTDEGKHTLAKIACDRKLGVRGLKSLLQQVLLDDMYNLNVGHENTLEINKQYIVNHLKSNNHG